MLVYDIMLTFPREVNKIWRKTRLSGLTVIWFCNRWVFLLMVIPTIASEFKVEDVFETTLMVSFL